jgi:hypothetical protein
MINPIFARGEKAEGGSTPSALGGNVQSPQLFGQMQLSGVDIDGNFMPFDMQPSQLAMNFNGTRSTLQGTVNTARGKLPQRQRRLDADRQLARADCGEGQPGADHRAADGASGCVAGRGLYRHAEPV